MKFLLFFVASTIVLLLCMSAMPGTYDEGIVLTGALRTMAGQLPHQDFYANYGPLAYYPLGWLFHAFGVSMLIERILFAVISGLILTTAYAILAAYCSGWVVFWAMCSVFLSFGLNSVSGSAMYPVSLINLLCVALVLETYVRRPSLALFLGIGVLTGISELIRYDTGIALFGVLTLTMGFAIFLRVPSPREQIKEFSVEVLACAAGFAAVVAPAVIYYLSRGSFQAFAHDIILYPSKYYPKARALPFPGIHLKSLDNIAVYLPLLLAVIALIIGIAGCLARRSRDGRPASAQDLKWHALLASFGLLALIMYLKGLVRASPPQMYMSFLPSLLLVAVLYQHRAAFRRPLARMMPALLALSVAAGVFGTLREVHSRYKNHRFLPLEMMAQARGTLPPIAAAWCRTPGPLTRGLCFLPDDDRIQAIEFIRNHTQPSDKLFVGVPHHDRIFGNDNITYFATERLPVTKWSHFDPILQNQLPVQQEMVREFQAGPPPYIMLDAEFDKTDEPNESSKSSGVTLLDDYLRSHYTLVETLGMLTIYKRMEAGR